MSSKIVVLLLGKFIFQIHSFVHLLNPLCPYRGSQGCWSLSCCLEQPLGKRFKGNPAEEDNPKLRFEAKYVELNPLGQGGYGSVFAGYRKSDHLHVAIKHVPNKYQYCKHVDEKGKKLSVEVAVMLKLRSGTSHSAGSKAQIALLDWYVLPHELILVLDRPMPAVDLQTYVRRDSFGEKEAKMILKQLVKTAISLQDKKIFHRDIKVENILIGMSSGAPQIRLIDFGVSCFTETHSEHTTFYGTEIHAPPEWWYGHTYSARPTTVWQLGIVLFECLHNKRFKSTPQPRATCVQVTVKTDTVRKKSDFDPQKELILLQHHNRMQDIGGCTLVLVIKMFKTRIVYKIQEKL
uniref:non-specific serine/threonine protein kinase n=1 Tax=Oryzias latipes TaxID=8090 RepID=A0A3P9HQT6_ORYLA